jgi:predicted transport protein
MMSDIKLFHLQSGSFAELPGKSARLEKDLQARIEANMDALLGVRFLATEYSTGKEHGGRIDSLGLDENSCPVILEYKRSTDENVINQGLFYLDWLMDHQAEFQLLVQRVLGKKIGDAIDWSSPRLLCIAGGFTKYDEYAVKQIDRNIDLIRYISFGTNYLMLELVNATTASTPLPGKHGQDYKTISEILREIKPPLAELLEELRTMLFSFGDDVQEKTLKYYLAFKRIKNFACVEVKATKGELSMNLKVDPKEVVLEPGFTRDVTEIGHLGTGNLELILRSTADLEKAEPLLRQSYESS